jgi:MFS family permease
MTAQHLKFAGGEWGGWTSYIVEYAPEGRRGFIGSWQQVSVGSGFLLGSLSAALLSSTLSPDAFMSWGWIRSCSAFSGRSKRRAPQLDPFARRVHVLGVDPFLLGILGAGQHVRIGAAAPLARVVFTTPLRNRQQTFI